jgi:hypothetical protein
MSKTEVVLDSLLLFGMAVVAILCYLSACKGIEGQRNMISGKEEKELLESTVVVHVACNYMIKI